MMNTMCLIGISTSGASVGVAPGDGDGPPAAASPSRASCRGSRPRLRAHTPAAPIRTSTSTTTDRRRRAIILRRARRRRGSRGPFSLGTPIDRLRTRNHRRGRALARKCRHLTQPRRKVASIRSTGNAWRNFGVAFDAFAPESSVASRKSATERDLVAYV
jgi:hypothetical protein